MYDGTGRYNIMPCFLSISSPLRSGIVCFMIDISLLEILIYLTRFCLKYQVETDCWEILPVCKCKIDVRCVHKNVFKMSTLVWRNGNGFDIVKMKVSNSDFGLLRGGWVPRVFGFIQHSTSSHQRRKKETYL